MLNEFASILMEIRSQRHETVTAMAEKLGVDRKDLTSIEIGRLVAPVDLPDKIKEAYELDDETYQKLIAAAQFEADDRIDLDNPCTGFGFGKKDQITQDESNKR